MQKLISLALLLVAATHQPAMANRIVPGDFPAPAAFTGKSAMPDFKGRDKDFADFRTRIRNGLEEGPNFAGEYSFISAGCGTGCSLSFVANNRTGQVFNFPLGGEAHSYLETLFQLDSRLVIAQYASFETNECLQDYYDFQNGEWIVLQKTSVGDLEACYNPIEDNLP